MALAVGKTSEVSMKLASKMAGGGGTGSMEPSVVGKESFVENVSLIMQLLLQIWNCPLEAEVYRF